MVNHNQRANMRKRVAQEAAELLYTEQEKEYKQAKFRAAKDLGIHVLPSNAEVAFELDRIAEEREGETRQKNLAKMRREALQIMEALEDFNPILVGSVWRGTAHRSSDIDIITYAQTSQDIVAALRRKNYAVVKTKVEVVTKDGEKRQSFHIYVDLPSSNQAEIVVRSPEDMYRQARCEIYGDSVTGLTILQLQQVLRENAQQKFVPT